MDHDVPEATAKAVQLLTNHGRVLIALSEDPARPVRCIAEQLQITPRSVQLIMADLERDGLIMRRRIGRRNLYRIDPEARFSVTPRVQPRLQRLLSLATETTVTTETPCTPV